MIRDICFYRCYNLKFDIIRIFIISICTDYYLLCENLQIIKTSNDVEEEVLSKEINDDELKEIKIHELISDDKKDTDFEENNSGLTSFTELPLSRR
jgi:hypothetical protein